MNLIVPILAQTADNAAATFFGLGIVGLLIALVLGFFWLWMLFDALTNESLVGVVRIVWALVIFFLPFIGALLYFFVGRRPSAGSGMVPR